MRDKKTDEGPNRNESMSCQLRVRLYKDDLVFGPGAARVLTLVRQTESLSEACREMSMAYSKGWHIIKRAEADLGFSLVEGRRGGARGGKMVLTEAGEQLLERYTRLTEALEKEKERLFNEIFVK